MFKLKHVTWLMDWISYSSGHFISSLLLSLKRTVAALIGKSNHFQSKCTWCFQTFGIHSLSKRSCLCFHLLNDMMRQMAPLARILSQKKKTARAPISAQHCSRTSWLCKTQSLDKDCNLLQHFGSRRLLSSRQKKKNTWLVLKHRQKREREELV